MHVIADAHIYDRHIPLVEKLLEREPYPAPQLSIDNSIKDFYAFRPEHFVLENYQCHPSIGKIPVADIKSLYVNILWSDRSFTNR